MAFVMVLVLTGRQSSRLQCSVQVTNSGKSIAVHWLTVTVGLLLLLLLLLLNSHSIRVVALFAHLVAIVVAGDGSFHQVSTEQRHGRGQ